MYYRDFNLKLYIRKKWHFKSFLMYFIFMSKVLDRDGESDVVGIQRERERGKNVDQNIDFPRLYHRLGN